MTLFYTAFTNSHSRCSRSDFTGILPIFPRSFRNFADFFAVIFLQRYSLTDVSLAPDDPAFLWYNVICVLSSTAGVCGCLYQLVKRSPRCLGCVPTADNALLLLVQNNIIGCLATADLLAVVGTLNVVKLRRSVQNGLSTHGQGLGLVLVSYIGSI